MPKVKKIGKIYKPMTKGIVLIMKSPMHSHAFSSIVEDLWLKLKHVDKEGFER